MNAIAIVEALLAVLGGKSVGVGGSDVGRGVTVAATGAIEKGSKVGNGVAVRSNKAASSGRGAAPFASRHSASSPSTVRS